MISIHKLFEAKAPQESVFRKIGEYLTSNKIPPDKMKPSGNIGIRGQNTTYKIPTRG